MSSARLRTLLASADDGQPLPLTPWSLRPGLRTAQRARLAPKVAIMLLQQHAHGLAMIRAGGAVLRCGRLPDEAQALTDRIDDGYPWGEACFPPAYIGVQRATIATRLGRSTEAVRLWGEVLPMVSPGRDWGVFTARLARAGEPERAADLAAEVVPVAASTGSARMRAELATLRDSMTPWRGQPPWRALEEALAGLPAKRRR
jgi:hypothetical protein